MMAPDDLGERRQVSHMPTIALSVAAILFLVVGAMSYRDFVRTSLEKEFAEKEERLMQRQGYYGNAVPGQYIPPGQQPYPQPAAGQVVPLQPLPGGYPPAPVAGATQPVANPAPANPAPAVTAYDPALPVPNDPEIDNIRQTLEQAREQGRKTEERYNGLAGNANQAPAAAAAAPQAETQISAELPDFLREAVQAPPGGNPEVEARLQKMRDQVRSAPSLAKVTSYNKDWGIVTFNAGTGQGVKVDQRFAVRRGSEILGWIKVDQVDLDQSIAVLVTKNRDSDTSVKPDVGDDLIDFELF